MSFNDSFFKNCSRCHKLKIPVTVRKFNSKNLNFCSDCTIRLASRSCTSCGKIRVLWENNECSDCFFKNDEDRFVSFKF